MMMLKKALIVVVFLLLLVSFAFLLSWLRFVTSPMLAKNKNPIVFIFPKSSSMHALSRELQQKGVLDKPQYFILLAYLDGATKSLQAGEYTLEPGANPLKLLRKMKEGKVVMHHFTIIPGWTFQQMLFALDKNLYSTHDLKGCSNDRIMKKIGHSGEIPEGRFLPETYAFALGTRDSKILQQAYSLLQKTLRQAWEKRSVLASYPCSYDALIAASILEKEAARNEERAIISGIMLQRLRKNMFLQMDPTVIYGLGRAFKGALTQGELEKDTPYNTYLHKRLPPTPICLPSKKAILATLHPMATNYLYFVAKGDGTHEFSSSLLEHNKAIKKYLLQGNKKKRRHE